MAITWTNIENESGAWFTGNGWFVAGWFGSNIWTLIPVATTTMA